jgi:NAD(P)-dependent dehydrogenase (short-subunit alcohol dehydrogenase family)
MKLDAKTVLITGGRRLGAKLALELAARGANIALSYHNSRDAMMQVVDECEHLGVKSEAFPADLRHPGDANSLVAETFDQFGSLDVLINLTSIYTHTPFDELKPADYDEMLSSNLTAPYFTALAAARAMRRQPMINGLQGKIIHFTDWAVDRPYRGYLPYLVAKGGLVTLTKALAVELAPTITVNAIAPGAVEPPADTPQVELEQIRAASALNRLGSPDDVINAVMYLLEGTDFVTGEVIRVDGGRFLGSTTSGA